MRAPEDWKKRRILETFLIKMQNPTLNDHKDIRNDHKDIRNLLFFRNGIT